MKGSDIAIAAVALLGAVFCGFADASSVAIPAAAVSLASLQAEAHVGFAVKYAAVGPVRVWVLFFAATFAHRLLWSAIAFTTGMVLAAVS